MQKSLIYSWNPTSPLWWTGTSYPGWHDQLLCIGLVYSASTGQLPDITDKKSHSLDRSSPRIRWCHKVLLKSSWTAPWKLEIWQWDPVRDDSSWKTNWECDAEAQMQASKCLSRSLSVSIFCCRRALVLHRLRRSCDVAASPMKIFCLLYVISKEIMHLLCVCLSYIRIGPLHLYVTGWLGESLWKLLVCIDQSSIYLMDYYTPFYLLAFISV